METKKELTLNEYQKRAMSTCMPSCNNVSYMLLNLIGEMGEFASKVAKAVRKEQLKIGWWEEGEEASENNLIPTGSFFEWDEMKEELKKELGDILWQTAGLAHVMGWTLEDVGLGNLDKLAKRKEAGTIVGDGDGIYDRKG